MAKKPLDFSVLTSDAFIDPANPQTISRALGAGGAILRQQGGDILSGLGSVTGFKPLETAGANIVSSAQRDLAGKYRSRVPRVEDIKSLGDFGEFALFNVAQNVPILLQLLLTRKIGGSIGKRSATKTATKAELPPAQRAAAIKKGTSTGETTGLFLGDVPLQYSEQLQNLRDSGVQDPELLALGASFPRALLDILPVELLFKGAGGALSSSGNRLRRTLTTAGKVGTAEALTETGQDVLGTLLNPNQSLTSPEAQSNFLNSLVAGFVTGGTFGVPAGLVSPAPTTPPTIESVSGGGIPAPVVTTQPQPVDTSVQGDLFGGFGGSPIDLTAPYAQPTPEPAPSSFTENTDQLELPLSNDIASPTELVKDYRGIFVGPGPGPGPESNKVDYYADRKQAVAQQKKDPLSFYNRGLPVRSVDELNSRNVLFFADDPIGWTYTLDTSKPALPGEINLINIDTGKSVAVPEESISNMRQVVPTSAELNLRGLEALNEAYKDERATETLVKDLMKENKARGKKPFEWVGKTADEIEELASTEALSERHFAVLNKLLSTLRSPERQQSRINRAQLMLKQAQVQSAEEFTLRPGDNGRFAHLHEDYSGPKTVEQLEAQKARAEMDLRRANADLQKQRESRIELGIEKEQLALPLETTPLSLPEGAGALPKGVKRQPGRNTLKELIRLFYKLIDAPSSYRKDGLLRSRIRQKLDALVARGEQLKTTRQFAETEPGVTAKGETSLLLRGSFRQFVGRVLGGVSRGVRTRILSIAKRRTSYQKGSKAFQSHVRQVIRNIEADLDNYEVVPDTELTSNDVDVLDAIVANPIDFNRDSAMRKSLTRLYRKINRQTLKVQELETKVESDPNNKETAAELATARELLQSLNLSLVVERVSRKATVDQLIATEVDEDSAAKIADIYNVELEAARRQQDRIKTDNRNRARSATVGRESFSVPAGVAELTPSAVRKMEAIKGNILAKLRLKQDAVDKIERITEYGEINKRYTLNNGPVNTIVALLDKESVDSYYKSLTDQADKKTVARITALSLLADQIEASRGNVPPSLLLAINLQSEKLAPGSGLSGAAIAETATGRRVSVNPLRTAMDLVNSQQQAVKNKLLIEEQLDIKAEIKKLVRERDSLVEYRMVNIKVPKNIGSPATGDNVTVKHKRIRVAKKGARRRLAAINKRLAALNAIPEYAQYELGDPLAPSLVVPPGLEKYMETRLKAVAKGKSDIFTNIVGASTAELKYRVEFGKKVQEGGMGGAFNISFAISPQYVNIENRLTRLGRLAEAELKLRAANPQLRLRLDVSSEEETSTFMDEGTQAEAYAKEQQQLDEQKVLDALVKEQLDRSQEELDANAEAEAESQADVIDEALSLAKPERLKALKEAFDKVRRVNDDLTNAINDSDELNSMTQVADALDADESQIREAIPKLQEAIELIQHMLGTNKVTVVTAASITNKQGNKIAGSYNPVTSIIKLALNAVDIVSVAAHEAYHAAQFKLLTDAERRIIRNQLRKGKALRAKLEALLQAEREGADELLNNPVEAEAYAFQFWTRGDLNTTGTVARIWTKIATFFERVKNMLLGRGFRSWEDVFNALYAGEYVNRDPGVSAESSFKQTSIDLANNVEPGGKTELYASTKVTDEEKTFAAAVDDSISDSVKKAVYGEGALHLTKDDFKTLLHKAYTSTVGSMRHIARHSPTASRLMELVNQTKVYRDELVVTAEEKLLPFLDASKTVRKKVGDALRKGAVEKKVWSVNVLQNRFHLNKQEIDWYNTIRSVIDDRIRLEYDTYIERAKANGMEETSPDIVEMRKTQDNLIATGYIPARRYGQYAVHVFKSGDPHTGTLLYSHTPTLGTANMLKDTLASKFAEKNVEITINRVAQKKAALDVGKDLMNLMDLIETMDIKLDDGTRRRLVRNMTDNINERSKRLARADVPGSSDDIAKILSEFNNVTASAVAHASSSKEMNNILISDEWHDTSVNGVLGGFYQDQMNKMINFMRSGDVYSDDTGHIAGRLRAAAATAFLGGNLSHGLIQLTQLAVASVPYLTNYSSVGGSYAQLAAAFKDTLKLSTPENRKLVSLRNAVKNRKGFGNLNRAEAKALLRAAEGGVTQAQMIYAMSGIQHDRLLAKSKALRKTFDLWMSPFIYTEEINRRTTFLAAFRMAKQMQAEGKDLVSITRGEKAQINYTKDFPDADEAAFMFAKEAVDETQFVYTKENRPEWARGQIGAILFTFKTFPIFMIELFQSLPRKGKLTMLATIFLASGMQGLFFADDLEDLLDTLGQRLGLGPVNIRKTISDHLDSLGQSIGVASLRDIFMHGMLNQITGLPGGGFNLSDRIGLGNLIPGTEMFLRGADIGQSALEILGPVGSLLQSSGKTLGAALDLDLERAGTNFPLSGIRNIAQGLRYTIDDNMARDIRGRLIAPVTGFQAFWKMIGFSPIEVNKQYELSKMAYKHKQYITAVRTDFMNELIKFTNRRDTAGARRVLAAVSDWNKAHPEPQWQIIIRRSDIRRAITRSRETASERAVGGLPRIQRQGFSVLSGSNF